MTLRTERLVLMDAELKRGRYPSVHDMCRLFEIQERTWYEDLRSLRDTLGLEIRYDRKRGGYFNADPEKKLPVFNLTHGEVFALTLGKEMLSQYVGTSFEPILRSAIQKLIERLPEKVHVEADDVKSLVRFDPGSAIPIEMNMFMKLNQACEREFPVKISYHSASKDETTTRVVEPYKLLQHEGVWYLVGWCRMRDAMRHFALHRMDSHEVLKEERFFKHDDFDVDAWLDKAFQIEHTGQEHTVRVHFKPRAARYIRERNWHKSQELKDHEDKSCTMQFVTQSLEEAKRWVLRYGSDACVLEPPELRKLIHQDLNRAASQYDSPVTNGCKELRVPARKGSRD